jgi:NADPH-dependent 2,4-dienoyl-CoA reductase/sulfur reductase-like enzyme
MPAQVVVLGGGVGGTLTANLLDRQLGRDAHVTVVDPSGMHLYQPGFLYAALGKANGRWLARDECTLLRRHVDLAVEAATLVDPDRGRVRLAHGGSMAFDYLVVATGARWFPTRSRAWSREHTSFTPWKGRCGYGRRCAASGAAGCWSGWPGSPTSAHRHRWSSPSCSTSTCAATAYATTPK